VATPTFLTRHPPPPPPPPPPRNVTWCCPVRYRHYADALDLDLTTLPVQVQEWDGTPVSHTARTEDQTVGRVARVVRDPKFDRSLQAESTNLTDVGLARVPSDNLLSDKAPRLGTRWIGRHTTDVRRKVDVDRFRSVLAAMLAPLQATGPGPEWTKTEQPPESSGVGGVV